MADGFELFTDRSVVAMRVNGELKDLATTVTESDVVEPVTIDSADGLGILRHSTAQASRAIGDRRRGQAPLRPAEARLGWLAGGRRSPVGPRPRAARRARRARMRSLAPPSDRTRRTPQPACGAADAPSVGE